MKISNEVKIGILGTFSIFLLIWGYNFLKGNNILSNDTVITGRFTAVDGLAVGAPVTINGLQVGAVTHMYLDQKNPKEVLVEMHLYKGVDVPKTVKPKLVTLSIMSGKAVDMEFEGSCSGGDCLQTGDEVRGEAGSMIDMAQELIEPYMGRIDSLTQAFKELAKSEESGLKKSVHDVQASIENLKVISQLLSVLLERSTNSFVNTMSHMESITGNVKANNEQITALMSNLATLSEELKSAKLSETLGATKNTIEEFGQLAEGMQGTLAETNKLMAQLQELTNFKDQEGLLSALMHDKALLQDVEKAIAEMSLLMEDIRRHPERYRTVLSGKYKPYGMGKAYKKEQKLLEKEAEKNK